MCKTGRKQKTLPERAALINARAGVKQGLAWELPPSSPPQPGPGLLDPTKPGLPTEDVATATRNGAVIPGSGPRHVALSPVGVHALGRDHFLEMPQLGVGAGMREPLPGLCVLLSLPAGSWPCPDSTSGAAFRGFQT